MSIPPPTSHGFQSQLFYSKLQKQIPDRELLHYMAYVTAAVFHRQSNAVKSEELPKNMTKEKASKSCDPFQREPFKEVPPGKVLLMQVIPIAMCRTILWNI